MPVTRGTDRDDVLNGTPLTDTLIGNRGRDKLYGFAGNDWLDGGEDTDLLDAGAGSDIAIGGHGDDVFVHRIGENAGHRDAYEGGTGRDTLRLELTAADWQRADVQADIARFLAHLDTPQNKLLGILGLATAFTFTSTNLTVVNIEKLQIVVDGKVLDPRDEGVIARADSYTVNEGAVITGSVIANDSVPDLVKHVSLVAGVTKGSLTLNADGTFSYNAGTAFEALRAGQTETVTFKYKVTDADGDSAVATATITIKGANDAATIAGVRTGSVIEDGQRVATGLLTVADVDSGEAQVVAQTNTSGAYGKFSVTASGAWTYTLNNTHAAVQALPAGATLQDTFTVRSKDGTDTETVVVTITGSNDAATISGKATGTVIEDTTLTATGKLTVSDIDTGEAQFVPRTGAMGTYGTFAINAAGTWTYTLNNASAAVQGLAEGQTVTDGFVVASKDGSASQTVVITVKGKGDGTTITGQTTGNAAEDTTLTASGTLTATGSAIVAQPGTMGGYGTFAITAAGAWTYTLNNTSTQVQALAAGQTVTDAFIVTSVDGTASKTVTLTITGTNDAPVASTAAGQDAGAVTEDTTLVASGLLTASDVDTGATATWSGTGSSAYGSFAVAANGAWTYTLADNAAVNALRAGQQVTETYTATVTDDKGATATETVTVTITGTNDAPTVSGIVTASITEGEYVPAIYLLQGAYDADAGETDTLTVANVSGQVPGEVNGTTLAVHPQNAEFQSLGAGQTRDYTFTYEVRDTQGASVTQTAVITVTGTNDAATISGTATGTVAEDAVVNTASGTLTVADVDTGEAVLGPVAAGTAGANGYGTFAVTAAGAWTYALDNSDPAVQALASGQTLTDTITVTSADGTASQVITVTITGTDDGATIAGDTTGAVAEDGTLTATGTLTVSDPDGSNTVVAQTGTVSSYGTFAITSAGAWTYTLNNAAAPVQALAAGQTVTDTFTVTSADGTASETVTLTITGRNDDPTSTPVTLSPVLEDSGSRIITSAELLANATDAEGQPIVVQAVFDLTGAGNLWDNFDGTWTFAPAANATGPANFQFVFADNFGGYGSAMATLDILPVNDMPRFGAAGTGAQGAALQTDGKLVVAISSPSSSGSDFALVRYNADGSLDTSFGTGDVRVISDLGQYDGAKSVVVQPDGKILAAGESSAIVGGQLETEFALVRYNSDGTVDTSFGGGDGIVLTQIGTGRANAQDIIVQPDGKILFTGTSYNVSGQATIVLIRYNADGSLDTEFGAGDGIVTTSIGLEASGWSVALQADGRIVVAGQGVPGGTQQDFALVRYLPDGTPDTSFGGGDGIVTTPIGSHDYGRTVVIQPDGNIVVAGTYVDAEAFLKIALVRYTTDGDLDSSFGEGGIAVSGQAGHLQFWDIAIQPDGKFVVISRGFQDLFGVQTEIVLQRFNGDGSLDLAFGNDGTVVGTFGWPSNYATGLAIQNDGKIVIVGGGSDDRGSGVVVARYNSDGSLDQTFDPLNLLGGTVSFTEGGTPVVLDADVSLYDPDLYAIGYAGASVTLHRSSGADASDVFGASGALGALIDGVDLVLSGVVIGTVTQNSAGILSLTFGADALQSHVDQALRLITYANNSESPPASVEVKWTASDGNAGAQGIGGALSTTGITTVNIAPINDAATITASASEDVAVVEAGIGGPGDATAGGQLTVADVDAGEASFRAPLAAALVGLYGDFTFNAATGVWGYTLDQARANALGAGQAVTDTLTVTSLDGTASRDIVVNVTGGADALPTLDLVVVSPTSGTVGASVALGNGTGGFLPPYAVATGGNGHYAVALGDLNSDGALDFVSTNSSGPNGLNLNIGLGNGQFAAGAPVSTAINAYFSDVAVNDLNRDGHADIVALSDAGATVLLGNGQGAFQVPNTIGLSSAQPVGLILADVNYDAILDIITLDRFTGSRVALGNGDGSFDAATASALGDDVVSLATGDLNGDGNLDLVSSGTFGLYTSLGDGNGSFGPATTLAQSEIGHRSVALGDVNNDDILDIVTTNYAGNFGASVLLGIGDGTFAPAVIVNTGGSGHGSVQLGDLSGDGYLDIVTTTPTGVTVTLNQGDGSFGTGTLIATPGQDFAYQSLALGNFDTSNPSEWLIA